MIKKTLFATLTASALFALYAGNQTKSSASPSLVTENVKRENAVQLLKQHLQTTPLKEVLVLKVLRLT